ncbi:hypothetical protein H5410_010417 [Solanum commersonii]|uniref:Uncharacterized protein n=1 Tax=Solanum commersonii TaxID=4109 RepID=A0A9J6AMD0_SOLCO|nr:hypothetical protein H5410_010417 [Solanum commersonii]
MDFKIFIWTVRVLLDILIGSLGFYNVLSLAKNYGVVEGLCGGLFCSNITAVFEGCTISLLGIIMAKIIGNTFEFTILITLRNQDKRSYVLFFVLIKYFSSPCVRKAMSCNEG